MKLPILIPEPFVKCISVEDRKRLGIETLDEKVKKLEAKSERDLANQIVQYLNLRNIEVIRNRTDKKSTANKGTPDLLFCLRLPSGMIMGCAFEIKFGSGVTSRAQNDMMNRLQTSPNGWHVREIRSLIEVIDFLREIGV